MDARSKRREATRRQLEQQLKERQAREARRKRAILITSVVSTVAVVALVVVLVVVLAGGSNNKPKAAASPSSASSSVASSSAAAPAVKLSAPVACAKPTGAKTASYQGVSVANAVNLKTDPKVTATSSATLKALACDDLVVGKGKAAAPGATVSVQYSGVLYKNGTKFDSSWASGKPASFALTSGQGGVIDGFRLGIGGTGKVAPMHVGGRRVILMPAQLGYGSTGQGSIPANADLVFVVDLLSVS